MCLYEKLSSEQNVTVSKAKYKLNKNLDQICNNWHSGVNTQPNKNHIQIKHLLLV